MSEADDETSARLARELALAEAELAELDRRRAEVLARVQRARWRLAEASVGFGTASIKSVAASAKRLTASAEPRPAASGPAADAVPGTPAEKVRLFQALFRGREDVFPTRFVSRRTGRAGYAPACANKFVRGVCELPRVKCGECLNQAFVPVDDRIVLDHLTGRHVMGVYPLLEDETCWLLAADFDKASWIEDVGAFRETCRAIGIPCVVERSRSGNGAHAWFFFATPVPASTARQMGCHLITETMARRHELRMDSYDRLFPNQDTLPRGGFGNLIALPLQHEARRHGNTLFLDEAFEPYPDPWTCLASVPRLPVERVEEIASEAARTGRIVGVRQAEPFEVDAAQPWLRPPSGRRKRARIEEPLPAAVKVVHAQRLFIEKDGLPSILLNQIKRLAAFQNPEFYKKQRMRLSTALTPRVIACAEELERHVALPRGCLEDLRDLVTDHGVGLAVEDRREEGKPLGVTFHGDLTPLQEQAARSLIDHDTGVLVAPPGVGKTVLGTHLVARRARSTLVLVHRRPLLDQWVAQLSMFLGIEEREIGRVGGGRSRPNGKLDVAMIQSLVRRDAVSDLVASYGHVIVDECHHVPAVSFERVLSEVRARYVLGLTATPHRRDGHQPILEMQLGPVRFAVDVRNQAAMRPFEHRLVVRETAFRLPDALEDASIQQIYRVLCADEARNRMIVNDVLLALRDGRSPIVLTERRDHLELLAERLRGSVRHLVVLRGGMGAKERVAAADQLDTVPDDEERLVLATGRYIGEGFDSARLDTLFLAMPVSWKGTLIQYSGRLHRLHAGKSEVRVYDYVDSQVPVLARMFQRRLATYRAVGYTPYDSLPAALAAGQLGLPITNRGNPE